MAREIDERGSLVKGIGAKLYALRSVATGLSHLYKNIFSFIDLKEGQELLDIGCGTGVVLDELAKRYPHAKLYGIDPSEDMLEIARRRTSPLIKYKVAYGDDLPFIPGSFDFVTTTLALHHMPPQGKEKTIREAYRVLRSGGKLLIVDLGRPRGFWGRFLAVLTRSHSHTKGNMEAIEASLRGLFEIERHEWKLGYIEFLLARKL